jgi:CO/xanthine dehydrogenase Mo-binding subunit
MSRLQRVGARLPRLEDGPLLQGKGRYVDDLPASMPSSRSPTSRR